MDFRYPVCKNIFFQLAGRFYLPEKVCDLKKRKSPIPGDFHSNYSLLANYPIIYIE